MDITPVVQALPTGPAPTIPATVVSEPQDDLVSRQFADVMTSGPVSADTPESVSGTTPATGPPSLGDAILSGLTQVTSGFQQAWDNVRVGVPSEMAAMSLSEMYEKQIQLFDFSLQVQTLGHGVSKVSQDLNELLKIQ